MKQTDTLWETANMENSKSFKPEGEDLWFSNERYAEELAKKGNVPGSLEHQNLGYNSKKEGSRPKTKR